MEVYLQQERRIRSAMAVWEPGICLISTELVFGWESRHPSPRDTDNRILNPLLSALFFFKKKSLGCLSVYHCMKGPPTYCLRSVRTRIKNETTQTSFVFIYNTKSGEGVLGALSDSYPAKEKRTHTGTHCTVIVRDSASSNHIYFQRAVHPNESVGIHVSYCGVNRCWLVTI